MAEGEGGVRWNPRSQRWERAAQTPAAPTAQGAAEAHGAADAQASADAPASAESPAGSPYSYPPVPPPARRRRMLLVAVTAAGVAVLGAAAVAGWLYLGHKGPDPGPAPQAEYTQVRDTVAGFSVRIPRGWEASPGETGYGAVYRPAGGDRSAGFQVFRATDDTMTACQILRESTVELSKNPGYREISREPVDGDGCEQVYEYEAAHAVVRLVVASDDTRWVLLLYGPKTDVPLVRKQLTTAVGSFRTD